MIKLQVCYDEMIIFDDVYGVSCKLDGTPKSYNIYTFDLEAVLAAVGKVRPEDEYKNLDAL